MDYINETIARQKKKQKFKKPGDMDVVIKHLNISQGWVIGTLPPHKKKIATMHPKLPADSFTADFPRVGVN